jgi:hypothetical protein
LIALLEMHEVTLLQGTPATWLARPAGAEGLVRWRSVALGSGPTVVRTVRDAMECLRSNRDNRLVGGATDLLRLQPHWHGADRPPDREHLPIRAGRPRRAGAHRRGW